MLDLSKFYSNNSGNKTENGTVFNEQYTLEEIKASQGNAPLTVLPSKNNPGKAFFACGRVRGYVADKALEKIQKHQKCVLVVSDVTTKDGNNLLVLHEMGESSNAIATF